MYREKAETANEDMCRRIVWAERLGSSGCNNKRPQCGNDPGSAGVAAGCGYGKILMHFALMPEKSGYNGSVLKK